MGQTTDDTVSVNDWCKFRKNFTATPFPEKPREGLECEKSMVKMRFMGANCIIQGSKYKIWKKWLYTIQEHHIVYFWSKFQINPTKTSRRPLYSNHHTWKAKKRQSLIWAPLCTLGSRQAISMQSSQADSYHWVTYTYALSKQSIIRIIRKRKKKDAPKWNHKETKMKPVWKWTWKMKPKWIQSEKIKPKLRNGTKMKPTWNQHDEMKPKWNQRETKNETKMKP